MAHVAHNDQSTVLRKDQYALVANMDGSFALYIPDLPHGTPVPRSVMLLAAIAAKIVDEEWVDGMLRDIKKQR
jgi:hypothetical protein